jgi:3-hydroxy acid dehydrogenase/malonic semialdehyde reductase
MKTAFITGATAGIGQATAETLAQNGHNLILCGRRAGRLKELKTILEKNHKIKVNVLSFDIQDYKQTEKAINSLNDEWKNIDILVNNAGLASGLNPIQTGELDDWEKMINTNVKGLLYITRLVAPLMIARQSGHIVNISSVAGKETYPNGNVYCATKHAVDSLSKAMRMDLLQHNIKVTNIAPGMVETEFSLVRFHGDAEKAKTTYKGLTPLHAVDVADAIYYAVSRPVHVNISDILITPAAQANARDVIRKN